MVLFGMVGLVWVEGGVIGVRGAVLGRLGDPAVGSVVIWAVGSLCACRAESGWQGDSVWFMGLVLLSWALLWGWAEGGSGSWREGARSALGAVGGGLLASAAWDSGCGGSRVAWSSMAVSLSGGLDLVSLVDLAGLGLSGRSHEAGRCSGCGVRLGALRSLVASLLVLLLVGVVGGLRRGDLQSGLGAGTGLAALGAVVICGFVGSCSWGRSWWSWSGGSRSWCRPALWWFCCLGRYGDLASTVLGSWCRRWTRWGGSGLCGRGVLVAVFVLGGFSLRRGGLYGDGDGGGVSQWWGSGHVSQRAGLGVACRLCFGLQLLCKLVRAVWWPSRVRGSGISAWDGTSGRRGLGSLVLARRASWLLGASTRWWHSCSASSSSLPFVAFRGLLAVWLHGLRVRCVELLLLVDCALREAVVGFVCLARVLRAAWVRCEVGVGRMAVWWAWVAWVLSVLSVVHLGRVGLLVWALGIDALLLVLRAALGVLRGHIVSLRPRCRALAAAAVTL